MTMNTTTEPQNAPTPNAAPSAALAPVPPSEAAQNWSLRQREAKAYSCSSLLPKEYQGESGLPNVLIAMEIALRIECSIFMVAQSLDIIHGRPGWRATFLIATVNASKRFTPLRFRFEGTPGKDDWGCRAVAKDLADGEPCVGALITIALAKAEGWYQRSGSKWQTIPEQMLMYRSAAFWTRVYCPELSLGIRTTEEAEDMVLDAPAYTVVAEPHKTVKDIEAAIRAKPSPEPAVGVETHPEPAMPTAPAKPAAAPQDDLGALASSLFERIGACVTLDAALELGPELLAFPASGPGATVGKALKNQLAEKRRALGEPA
jgi:hypothetical protein